jgi:arylsulfatase A-like enzyme
LDDLGLAEDTLVIFSSDNGPARASNPTELSLMYDTATGAGWGIGASKGITGGRKGYKASLFEGGIGVPFIVRWPAKVCAGKVDETSLISAVDLLPTFCNIAGAKFPKGYQPDGINITEILQGKTLPKRTKPLYWKAISPWPAHKAKPDHWVSWTIVKDEWKLVANRDLSHHELYRISKDYKEAEDLATKEKKVSQDLLKKIHDWKATLPDGPKGNVFSSLRKEK